MFALALLLLDRSISAGLLEREVGGGDAVRPLLLDQGKPIIDFEGDMMTANGAMQICVAEF